MAVPSIHDEAPRTASEQLAKPRDMELGNTLEDFRPMQASKKGESEDRV